MAFKFFRRHSSDCSRGYAKEDRIYEHDSQRATGRSQCDCVIYAEGQTPTGYVQKRSTKKRDWKEARFVALPWQMKEPEEGRETKLAITGDYRLFTVGEAVKIFHADQIANGSSEERINQFRQLLDLRLMPFANEHRVEHIQEMDNAFFWSSFRRSWRDLNPLKRKTGEIPELKPVARSTDKKLVNHARFFIKYCISREWLSDQWLSRDHGVRPSSVIVPKEPFSDQDMLHLYKMASRYPERFDMLVLMWVMRYTGLRISDAVMLSTDSLVPLQEGTFTHAIWCNPRKTQNKDENFVLIPIPNGRQADSPNLVAALQSLPVKHGKYFFTLGRSPLPELNTKEFDRRAKLIKNQWSKRLERLFLLTTRELHREGLRFDAKPHPHRFRHTFCARLLQAGMSVRAVASYIGDTEETVRKHYAKFCVSEQRSAARAMSELLSSAATAPADPLKSLPEAILDKGSQ